MFIKYSLLFILKYNNKQYIIPYILSKCVKNGWTSYLFLDYVSAALNDKVLVG